VVQTPANPPPIFRGTRLVSFAVLPSACPRCKVLLTGSFGDSDYRSEVTVNPATDTIPDNQIIKLGAISLIKDIEDRECDGDSCLLSKKYGVLSKETAFVGVCSSGEVVKTAMVPRRVNAETTFFCWEEDEIECAPETEAVYTDMCPMCPDECAPPIRKNPRSPPRETAFLDEAEAAEEDDIDTCPIELLADDDEERIQCLHVTALGDEEECCCECEITEEEEDIEEEPDEDGKVTNMPQTRVSLDSIIDFLNADGSFPVDSLESCGFNPDEVQQAIPDSADKTISASLLNTIWITVVVIEFIRKLFASKETEWKPIVTKCEKYARKHIGDALFAKWKESAKAFVETH